jgi:hypothetical protein
MTSISGASPIEVQSSTFDPTCAGLSNGRIVASVNGGNMPYQYLGKTEAVAPPSKIFPVEIMY